MRLSARLESPRSIADRSTFIVLVSSSYWKAEFEAEAEAELEVLAPGTESATSESEDEAVILN